MGSEVRVELGTRSYTLQVGGGLLASLGARIADLGQVGPLLAVTDANVEQLHGAALRQALLGFEAAGGGPVAWVVLPPGEAGKQLAAVETLWDAALGLGADRSLVVLAFGGGVVGDLAGFAAATLLRGVRLFMVPTTLLAQVDASVGGKTGFNRPQGKNLIGAFKQPEGVLADIDLLSTLPDRDLRAGMAEVVKAGAVLDAGLFEMLERRSGALLARDPAALEAVVARCCALKAAVVARDEREAGLRRVLNFGHTVGHALEKLTGFSRLLHGEAVAIGMVVAARLSCTEGLADPSLERRLVALVQSLGLPATVPDDLDAEAIAEAIGYDKKRDGEGVRAVLCPRIGAFEERVLSPRTIAAALR